MSRSRYHVRGIGADVFAATPVPSCPPGQHWVDDTPQSTLKGIGACEPDVVHLTPIVLRTAPQPPVVTTAPAPAPTGDRAAAPAVVAPAPCPPEWPLWWLFVAAAAGIGAGYYAQRHQKKVKRNAGRIAGRIVNRASDVALARLLG